MQRGGFGFPRLTFDALKEGDGFFEFGSKGSVVLFPAECGRGGVVGEGACVKQRGIFRIGGEGDDEGLRGGEIGFAGAKIGALKGAFGGGGDGRGVKGLGAESRGERESGEEEVKSQGWFS